MTGPSDLSRSTSSVSPSSVSQAKHRKKMNQVHPEPQPLPAQGVPVGPLVLEASAADASAGPLAPTEIKHPFSKTRIRVTTAIFTLIASLLFADQNLLSPNLSAAAHFFGMDDTQKDVLLGGYVNAAFFAVGAPSALIVGWLADRYNRRNMLFIVALTGQIPCLCTIFVTTYWQFMLTRLLTGVSVGGAFPLLYSLLGDMFPISQRAFVSSFIQIATGAGVFVGQMLAAWVGPATDWRMPFVVVAAPSILCSIAMVLVVKEPPRGAMEEALQDPQAGGEAVAYSERITWPKLKVLMKVPTNWLVVMQGLPGSISWGVFNTYFNDYLQIKNGWDAGIATLVITVFGIGAAFGVLGGGFLGQWLYNRRKEWSPVFGGFCVLVAMGPFYFLINMELASLLGVALIVAFVGGLFGAVAGPNVKAIMLNVNDPESRGVALALSTMTDDVGKALGPFIIAAFISSLGRQTSFNVAVCGSAPAGVMIAAIAFYIRKDEARVQDKLDEWRQQQEANRISALESNGLPRSGSHSSCSGSRCSSPSSRSGSGSDLAALGPPKKTGSGKLGASGRGTGLSLSITDAQSTPRQHAELLSPSNVQPGAIQPTPTPGAATAAGLTLPLGMRGSGRGFGTAAELSPGVPVPRSAGARPGSGGGGRGSEVSVIAVHAPAALPGAADDGGAVDPTLLLQALVAIKEDEVTPVGAGAAAGGVAAGGLGGHLPPKTGSRPGSSAAGGGAHAPLGLEHGAGGAAAPSSGGGLLAAQPPSRTMSRQHSSRSGRRAGPGGDADEAGGGGGVVRTSDPRMHPAELLTPPPRSRPASSSSDPHSGQRPAAPPPPAYELPPPVSAAAAAAAEQQARLSQQPGGGASPQPSPGSQLPSARPSLPRLGRDEGDASGRVSDAGLGRKPKLPPLAVNPLAAP